MTEFLSQYKRVVIKIGSSLLVDPENGLRKTWLDSLLKDVAELANQDTEILIVSSGAIALGRRELLEKGIELRDGFLKLEESQAAAAIGQIALSRLFSETLKAHSLVAAQILLTIGDTEQRRRYLNARNTIATALKWKAIPIINENDSVATSEIRYGDNDRLAARVATMCSADLLILFSDIDGLYDAPPADNPNAKLIPRVKSIDADIEAMAGEAASIHSRGGMKTKIDAAKIATSSGTTMVIASGKDLHPLSRLADSGRGTWFDPNPNSISDRKKWIAGGLEISGSIEIDAGALVALERGKSLLSAGVTKIEGKFQRGDTVAILGPHGHAVARGLAEYDSKDAISIVGLKSSEISNLLGPSARSALVHRDNLVLETQ
ncbi:glutamate 5-kinase [Mariniblastus fucicola]|uniref:Glutamate 5-kinase n=1 Tax=Mariniblastus fucicola TaxID=980251 RepID=A0A5B9PA84_9BACT|nr:glutamate 5-kinase [Mariniblastus fucicola]QEG23174.1 Glutamate 5-kinase [Mariniblastus fucicola]